MRYVFLSFLLFVSGDVAATVCTLTNPAAPGHWHVTFGNTVGDGGSPDDAVEDFQANYCALGNCYDYYAQWSGTVWGMYYNGSYKHQITCTDQCSEGEEWVDGSCQSVVCQPEGDAPRLNMTWSTDDCEWKFADCTPESEMVHTAFAGGVAPGDTNCSSGCMWSAVSSVSGEQWWRQTGATCTPDAPGTNQQGTFGDWEQHACMSNAAGDQFCQDQTAGLDHQNCGTFNGEFLCVASIASGGCAKTQGGGEFCVTGSSGEINPLGLDGGTPPEPGFEGPGVGSADAGNPGGSDGDWQYYPPEDAGDFPPPGGGGGGSNPPPPPNQPPVVCPPQTHWNGSVCEGNVIDCPSGMVWDSAVSACVNANTGEKCASGETVDPNTGECVSGEGGGGADFCSEHPDAAMCAEFGDAEDPGELGAEDRGDAITQELSASGTCPADKVFHFMGKDYTFSMAPMCDFASGIRPMVLGLAWLGAGLVVFRSARV